MKLRYLLIVVPMLAIGCGSPTQGLWIQRAGKGVALAEKNTNNLFAVLEKNVQEGRKGDVAIVTSAYEGDMVAAFDLPAKTDDEKKARAQAIKGASTKFAERLGLAMTLWKTEDAKLDDQKKVAAENYFQIRLALQKAEFLRKSWGSTTDELKVQVEHLTGLVERYIVDRRD